ncbi:MAG: hypothetical protein ACI4PE_02845 [Bacilli bacterium]
MEEIKEKIEEIKNNLTLDQIESLLFDLGAEPYRQGNIIISKTICHCGESHKLFYYDNTKLFRCYTECSDIFDIFELIIKVQKILGNDFTLFKALKFIINFFNINDTNKDFFKELNQLED